MFSSYFQRGVRFFSLFSNCIPLLLLLQWHSIIAFRLTDFLSGAAVTASECLGQMCRSVLFQLSFTEEQRTQICSVHEDITKEIVVRPLNSIPLKKLAETKLESRT